MKQESRDPFFLEQNKYEELFNHKIFSTSNSKTEKINHENTQEIFETRVKVSKSTWIWNWTICGKIMFCSVVIDLSFGLLRKSEFLVIQIDL